MSSDARTRPFGHGIRNALTAPTGMRALRTLALGAAIAASYPAQVAAQLASAGPGGPAWPQHHAKSPGWSVEWTPYLWASGLSGEVGIRGRTADIDLDFADVVENLDGGLMLPVEMRAGRWGVLVELILLTLSDHAGTPGPLFDTVEMSADQTLIELSPRYTVVRGSDASLDVLAGARSWHISSQLTFRAAGSPDLLVGGGQRWVDPIIGARLVADPARRWPITIRGDIGGFGVGSDLTWQLLGVLGYVVSDVVTVRAGYRHLDVDFEEDDDGFTYDVGTGGVVIGVSIRP